MEQHKQIQMYIGFEEGGCQDIATIKLEGFSLVANNELEALKAQRDALAAQNKVLHLYATEFVCNMTDENLQELRAALDLTPQQALAEIRADAVLAYLATLQPIHPAQAWLEIHLTQYAATLRQGGE